MRRVETFRVRQENALANFGAEVDDPPMELRLRIIGRVTGDGSVANSLEESQHLITVFRYRVGLGT
jgi:hypothetical protein